MLKNFKGQMGTIPCLYLEHKWMFSFFSLILSPAGGSNQTLFLNLQGILHRSPTPLALS